MVFHHLLSTNRTSSNGRTMDCRSVNPSSTLGVRTSFKNYKLWEDCLAWEISRSLGSDYSKALD